VDPDEFTSGDSALEPYALTTIPKVELALNRLGVQRSTAQESEDDAYIADLINSYSSAAQTYMNRFLRPLEEDVTHKFRYDGNGTLNLAPYELRDATSMTFYSDRATTQSVPSTLRSLRPAGGNPYFGSYGEVHVPLLGKRGYAWPVVNAYPWGWLEDDTIEVSILGDWGAARIPAEVERAVIIACALGYRKQESSDARVLGPALGGGFAGSPDVFALGGTAPLLSLPPDSRAMLDPFVRSRSKVHSISLI
jgi:hypothetical protein